MLANLIILLHLHILITRSLLLNNFNLHSYNVRNNWQAVVNVTSNTPIQQLHISSATITSEGLLKLFQSDFSRLRVLNLTSCIMSPLEIKLLLQQDFIYWLHSLILDDCNIQCEDLAVLKQRKTNLSTLSLQSNFISAQGFKYLSRLVMNLTSLNLYGNSLIHDDSIQSLISLNLAQIKALNVGKTSISSKNLLKILNQVEAQKLEILTIRENTYPLQFYRNFTLFHFDCLEFLDLSDLAIDQDGLSYFTEFKAPKLTELRIDNNYLTSETGVKIIRKQNMPLLQKLSVAQNFLNSQFIRHLAAQNYQLTRLEITKLDRFSLKQIPTMNFSRMQELRLRNLRVNAQVTELFFKLANLSALKVLQIGDVRNGGNLFNSLCNCNLSSLQELSLGDIGKINWTLLQNQGLLPKLKRLTIKFYNEGSKQQVRLIETLQQLAPNLEECNLALLRDGLLLETLLNGSLKYNKTKPLKVKVYKLDSSQFNSEAQLQLQMLLHPHQNKILKMHLTQIFDSILLQMFQTKRVTFLQYNSILDRSKLLGQFMTAFFVSFDFTELQIVKDLPYIPFINWHIKNNNNSCFLPSLTKLIASYLTQKQLDLLSRCIIPNLQQLTAHFLKLTQQQISLNFLYLNYLQIKNLPIYFTKSLFQQASFRYLRYLDISSLQLSSMDVADIVNFIPNFNRIRYLDISHNFINGDLSFLVGELHLRLVSFRLNSVLLTPQALDQMCENSFQFTQQIDLSNDGLDDNKWINLLNCLSKDSAHAFSKLDKMDISMNSLETAGIQEFMNFSLPVLKEFNFFQNNDPQIFNSVFKHQASRRLTNFHVRRNYLSSFDGHIDHTNTKRIQRVTIASQSLRNTDIKALSSFKFDSLLEFNCAFQKVDDCKSLQLLTGVLATVDRFSLRFKQISALNTQCLNSQIESEASPSIIIFILESPYGYGRNFVQYFLKQPHKISQIYLQGAYLSDEKLVELTKTSDLSNLQVFVLQENDSNDFSIEALVNLELPMLRVLSLNGNQHITHQSLSMMKDRTYLNLQVLSLARTSIGDRGVEYLIRNQFPQLIILDLHNTDITALGIMSLGNLIAPLLQQIDLSCNDLSADDLSFFNQDRFQELRQILVFPSLTESEYQRLKVKFNRNRTNSIQIITTIVKASL